MVEVGAKRHFTKEYKGKSLFYFVKDRLYRVRDTDPVGDRIMVYDCQEHVDKVMVLSEFKRERTKAYTLPEMCKIIGRSYWYTRRILIEELPYIGILFSYEPHKLDDPATWRQRFFTKQDILDVHKYMANLDPRGEGLPPKAPGRRNYPVPKKKLVKRTDMPTREEVLARLNSDEVYYVKDDDGNFKPVYRPKW